MPKFYELFSHVYGDLKKDYDKQWTSIQEIVRRYTQHNSPENMLTNNILRASKNPAEIYYCQPYFKALFEAIKSLYLKQKPTLSYPMLCFRGASASSEEIENYKKNTGHIVQNLGFLSTSTDLASCENFAKNLMFVITINQEERDEELDFGYAKIREYSQYPTEEEVIFNPLNTFQIQKIEKRIIKAKN